MSRSTSPSDEDEKQHDPDPNYVDWKNMQNIHVVCRFRPINHRERREEKHAKLSDIPPTTTNHGQCVNIHRHRHSHDSIKHGSSPLRFHLDRVLPSTTSQKAMYKIAAKPMVDACLAGYNATILAYGQTGSGKTYTMFGPKKPKSDQIGCVQRSLSYLFAQLNRRKKKKRVTKWKVLLHFVQLYREQWMDLLEPAHADKKHIRFDPVTNSPYVPNLKSVDVRGMDEVNAFLAVAQQNRVTEKTAINAASSRSHMILTLQMEQTLCDGTLKKSKLHFADLADSESYDSNDANQKKMAEMANINLSLTNLTTCINYLSKGRKASHRSAQLTFYLMDGLGGNSKTTLAVLASPHICNRNETIRALRFAKTAKAVRNKAKVNKAMSRAKLVALVKKLQRENKQLKARLALFDEHCAVDTDKKSSLRTRGRSKSMQSLTRTATTPRLIVEKYRSVDLQTSVADHIHL